MAQAVGIIAEKKILTLDIKETESKVTGPVLSFWVSIAGLPISLALVPWFEKITFVTDIKSIILVIGHAGAAGLCVMLFYTAVELTPAILVSLAITAEQPMRTLAQYVIIPEYQASRGGPFDIIGSVVVTIALCLPGIWYLIDKWKTQKEELLPLTTFSRDGR